MLSSKISTKIPPYKFDRGFNKGLYLKLQKGGIGIL